MNSYQNLIFWAAGIAIIFIFLWYKGYLLRLSNYVTETREELRKCTWPTQTELKGSTMLVLVAIVMLGAFTVILDMIMTSLMRIIVT